MTLEDAKQYLLRNVMTPSGSMTLYGINILPNLRTMGLIFYTEEGKQLIFFSNDCSIISPETHRDGSVSIK